MKMKKMIYLKNVVTLQLNVKKCSGCGMCIVVCPHTVLSMSSRKVQIENKDACMECGACAMNCPTEALTVQSGVGCAAAVINSALGRTESCCGITESMNDAAKDQIKSCC
jgi:ferredoxin